MLRNWIGLVSSCAIATSTFVVSACSDDDDGDSPAAAGSGGSAGKGSGGSAGKGSGGSGGASGGEGGDGGDGSGGAADPARIRVLHLSPDVRNVDVFVNAGATPVVENLEFPDGTDYLEVPAATYDFDVSATGTTAQDAVLSIAELALAAGSSYTAVAYDELASIKALPLVDDYAGLAAGDLRVRAVHLAAGVGQVDIWDVTGTPAPLYEDVDFGVAGDALDIPAGAYTLGIDVDDDATPDLTFALPELEAGTVVNLFAVADDPDVFLIAHLPNGTTARIDPE